MKNPTPLFAPDTAATLPVDAANAAAVMVGGDIIVVVVEDN